MKTMIEQIEQAGLRAVLLMTLALFSLYGAQPLEAQIPAPLQDGVIALTGGTIHTVSGASIQNGTILFEDGVITAIGANVSVPAGAERVDVSGKHVYPGLINAFSDMGLFEIGGFDVTIDLNELGDINPNVRAEVAFNPESRHIGVARSNGVLVSVTAPTGGLISGMAASMMMDGWTYEQMLIKSGTALMVNWPNPGGGGGGGFGGFGGGGGGGNQPSYGERVSELRDVFATARAYRDAKAVNPSLRSDSRWEAMIPVLNGDVPVVVNANDLRQIQDAVTWSEEEGVRIVIRGGRDAGYVADHLARRGIPVVLTSVLNSPNRDWAPYDREYSAPSRLHDAGVRFAISAGSSAAYAGRLPYEAGTAVAFGLPEDEAVKAVTLYPAQFLGIDHRVGSLETGKDATLLITTGNPLDYPTIIEQAYVQGRKIDMNDSHRNFFEKYQEKSRRVLEAAGGN